MQGSVESPDPLWQFWAPTKSVLFNVYTHMKICTWGGQFFMRATCVGVGRVFHIVPVVSFAWKWNESKLKWFSVFVQEAVRIHNQTAMQTEMFEFASQKLLDDDEVSDTTPYLHPYA